MLVISRKFGEGFTIGNNVHVKIVDLGNGRVRIGIEAPRDVKILRDELVEHEKPKAA